MKPQFINGKPKLNEHTTPSLTALRGQCSGCGSLFFGMEAFHDHRYGEHEGNQRKCYTEEELLTKLKMYKDDLGFFHVELDEKRQARIDILKQARDKKRANQQAIIEQAKANLAAKGI